MANEAAVDDYLTSTCKKVADAIQASRYFQAKTLIINNIIVLSLYFCMNLVLQKDYNSFDMEAVGRVQGELERQQTICFVIGDDIREGFGEVLRGEQSFIRKQGEDLSDCSLTFRVASDEAITTKMKIQILS